MYSLFKVTPDLAVRKTDGAFSISFVTSDMSNVFLDTGDATGIKVGLTFNHAFTATPPFLINIVSDYSLVTDIACTNQSLTACDVSRFENLEYLDISNNSIDSFEISQNSKLTELNISNNQLTSDNINEIIVTLDEFGLESGTLDYSNNAELPIGDIAASSYDSLISKGWSITGGRPQGEAMVLVIDTTKVTALGSDINSVIIPAKPSGATATMDIDWGDGSVDSYNSASQFPSHTYATSGLKEVKIIPTSENFLGTFEYINDDARDKAKIVDIQAWGSLWKWATCNDAFDSCINLDISASDITYFNGSCTNMFRSCSSLTQLINVDVSSVTSMRQMLSYATNFDYDISYWDTSSVTDMSFMFNDATIFNQPLNSWDVSNVVDMSNMFRYARLFNQPLNNWDVSKVTNMQRMFMGASDFDQDLSNWNVTALLNANNMFRYIALSTINYDALLIGWEAQNVQDNVSFDAGNSTYTLGGAAETARQNLINDHNWSIVDGGGV